MSNQTTNDWATGVLNKLTGTGEKLAVVEYKLDTFTDYTKEKFKDIDIRLIKVENKLEEVDNRLIKVENKLEEVDNRLIKVENKLEEVDNRLIKVENKLEVIDEKLDKITERLDTNDDKFAEIAPLMQQLKILIKLASWTLGGVGAIAFSIAANYLYAFFHS